MPWMENNMNLGDGYDWATFSLADGQTNYDVKSNQSALFLNIPIAGIITIETSRNISVRFNSTAFPAVALDAGASPMELVKKLTLKNLFLTNASGGSSTIRIWLFV